MLVYVNGQFLPETEAAISISDRALLYGDGLFETLRVHDGRIVCLAEHLSRLNHSASFFQMPPLPADSQIAEVALDLLRRNGLSDAILRIQISRGTGPRGYSPKDCKHPALIMTLHPAPQGPADRPPSWRLATVPWNVSSSDPTLRHKTCSRILNVLARAEAERLGADDALLLNERGQIAETTCSNLFWITAGTVHTPPLEAGILPGITRRIILDLCRTRGIATCETAAKLDALRNAGGLFLTLSSWGIVEVSALDGVSVPSAPLTQQIWTAYQDWIRRQPMVSSKFAQSA